MNNDLISRSELKKALHNFYDGKVVDEPTYILRDVFCYIDNAPTVEAFTKEDMAGAYNEGYACGGRESKRPQGEWVRKEDIIHYIATQYSKHNELVPIWLSIGDLKGGEEE